MTSSGLFSAAVAHDRRYRIRVEAILTDNGSANISITHALACRGDG